MRRPAAGQTHLGIALGIKACQHGNRVAFATARQWGSRLEEARDRNTLDQKLKRVIEPTVGVQDSAPSCPCASPQPSRVRGGR
ncbi:MAG: ATP-binding protein [Solirubrobacteraceae bacterium]